MDKQKIIYAIEALSAQYEYLQRKQWAIWKGRENLYSKLLDQERREISKKKPFILKLVKDDDHKLH